MRSAHLIAFARAASLAFAFLACDREPIEPVRVVPQLATVQPRRVAYSPRYDGQLLVLEASGRLGLWDVIDPRQPLLFATIPAAALDATFSADATAVVGGGIDGRVRWWALDGQLIAMSVAAHDSPVRAIAAGPDFVASGDEAGALRLWREDGTPIGEPLTGHDGPIVSIAIAPGGDILTVGGDGTARRWRRGGPSAMPALDASILARQVRPPDPMAFRQMLRLDVNWGWDHAVAVSPDGGVIAAALFDGALRFWNRDGTSRAEVRGAHAARPLRALAFSPRGDAIVTGGFDGRVRTWALDGTPRGDPIDAHLNAVYSVSFAPRGDRLATTGADDRVRLWTSSGEKLGELPAGNAPRALTVAMAAEPPSLAMAGSGASLLICPLGAAGCAATSAPAAIASLAFAPDGTSLAVGSVDGGVRRYAADGKPGDEPLHGRSQSPARVAFMPDGERIASGSDAVRMLDRRGVVWEGGVMAPDSISAVAVAPRGDIVAVGGLFGHFQVWNSDGTPRSALLRLPRENVVGLVFAPDGASILLAGGNEDVVHVRGLDGADSDATLRGHRGAVTALAASSARGLAASGSADGSVCVWQMPARQVAAVEVGVPVDQLGFAKSLLWVRAGSAMYVYDAEWRLIATGVLQPDGPTWYTPDGWFAGPPHALDRLRLFDATGALLPARAAAERASPEHLRAVMAAALAAR